jgi:hypothetical protein
VRPADSIRVRALGARRSAPLIWRNRRGQRPHRLLDLGHPQFVGEFEAEGCDNLVGRKMGGDDAVRPFDAVLIFR